MCFCIPYQSKAPKGVNGAKCVKHRSFLRPCSLHHECRLAGFCIFLTGWQIVLCREWTSSAWGETQARDNSFQGWLLWNSSLCTWVSSNTDPSCMLWAWFLSLGAHIAPPLLLQVLAAKVCPYLCYHQYIMLLLKDMECDVGRAANGSFKAWVKSMRWRNYYFRGQALLQETGQ